MNAIAESTETKVNSLTEKLTDEGMLVSIPRLINGIPDLSVLGQLVVFGTSGQHVSVLKKSFNESHILAITQSICLFHKEQKIDGPLYIDTHTHLLSEPVYIITFEVLAANGLEVMIAEGDQYIPKPDISHAILQNNKGRKIRLADRFEVKATAE